MHDTAPNIVEDRAPEATRPEPSPADSHFPIRRMIRFVSIVAAILLTTNAFVCATLSHFTGIGGWLVWQAIPALVPLTFIATTLLRFRHPNAFLRFAYIFSASWLGLLNFAFFASAACWIVEGITWLAGSPAPRLDIAAVLFGIALLTTIYGLINASWLRITRVTVRLPNLSNAWQGHTIALTTDLHLGPISGPDFVRRIISQLRSLKPDAVLISGDMFDGSPVGVDRLVAPWSEYQAPRGIYYVTGNHDEFADRNIFIDAVKRTGIRVLNNEKATVDGLQIIGVHDSEASEAEELRRILQQAQVSPDQASILLSHKPSNLAVPEEAGVNLQLSGHTHHGQIWPWSLLVSRIYGQFAYGLGRHGKLQVYTSSGAGTWGPPLRVSTKSEIVLIRLEAA